MKKTVFFSMVGSVLTLASIRVGYSHEINSTPSCVNCSPHYACGSKGGSVFSSCYRVKHEDGDKDYYRTVNCAAGTACANALCGSGKKLVNGKSWSYSPKNGGWPTFQHFLDGGVSGYSCQ